MNLPEKGLETAAKHFQDYPDLFQVGSVPFLFIVIMEKIWIKELVMGRAGLQAHGVVGFYYFKIGGYLAIRGSVH